MDATTTLSAERLLRQLEWRVVRRLDGLLQGDYRSLLKGAGIDFTDLREYTPGDDLRHIEWNVTARLDTPWVREYDEDREITTWLLLDRSASMGFGPVDRQKDLVLAEVAAILASVLSRGGSRVGAIVLGSGAGGAAAVTRVVTPHTGRTQVLRIAQTALAPAQGRSGTTLSIGEGGTGRSGRSGRRRWGSRKGRRAGEGGAPTDLRVLLRYAAGLARRRSLVIVVSDFIAVDGWQDDLGGLARRHEVLAIRLTDPRETELPDVGPIYVEDAETGEQLFVDTSDPDFRERLRSAAEEHAAGIARGMARAGVELHLIGTDEDLVRALVRISTARRRRRR